MNFELNNFNTDMDKNGIILSGGWGYKNLGDDALLIASIKLIRKFYPIHKIYVLTFDTLSGINLLHEFHNIEIIESTYNNLFGDKYIELHKDTSGLLEHIQDSLHQRIEKRKKKKDENELLERILNHPDEFIQKQSDNLEKFRDICEKSNMYIMSGGGYINDWVEMLVSKYCEVMIAKSKNLECIMMGQTIGQFNNANTELLTCRMFANIDRAFFRDDESIKDINRWGYNSNQYSVPDIALYENITCKEKDNQIVYIPFEGVNTNNLKNICQNLVSIAGAESSSIILTVSQQWYNQIHISTLMFDMISKSYGKVKIIIPEDVFELQNILQKSKLCISNNLHGLILAYRAGTPIVCLNNKRKFKTFMKLIDAENLLLPIGDIQNNELKDKATESKSLTFKCDMLSEQILDNVKKILK